MTKSYHILLVDDHTLLRQGVEAMLQIEPDFKRITHASSGAEALAVLRTTSPDIILLDRRMPDSDGFDLLTELRKISPGARIIMMTASATAREVSIARGLGAHGHLSKSVRRDTLINTIRRVLAGESCYEPQSLPRDEGTRALTPREFDVLENLRRGLSNQDISSVLGISEHTVKAHVKVIFAKLGASNRSEAVTRGLELGILEL